MDFCKEEIERWEQALCDRNMRRMYKTVKNYRDPRRESVRDYRSNKGTNKYLFYHESKEVRRLVQREFRRKMSANLYHEVYYKPVPHDYKTYGWLTC